MTSREIIRRVLSYDQPPRIGFTYGPWRGQSRLNDLAGVSPGPALGFDDKRRLDGEGGEQWVDEWGCTWRRIAGHTDKGEVVAPAIAAWDQLDTYQPPRLDDPARYAHGLQVREQYHDRYLLGSLTGCCFNRARYLRTFEGYLADCAGSPEMIHRLNRLVSDIVLAQVDIYADLGCDGVLFAEDWGTQDRLLVSPRMWHEMFEWTFSRLIERAHRRNLTVWMHSCGYVREIIPPLVALGLDVFQFSQPEIHGLDLLAECRGRATMWCSVDAQRTLPTGDEALIRQQAREMVAKLGGQGGFIAKDMGDPGSLGVDPLWLQWGYEEFKRAGVFNEAEAGLERAEL